MIACAHIAYDGTRSYRDRHQRDVAFAAGAHGILSLAREYPGWRIFGSPTQEEGLFLLLAPGHGPEEIPLDPGSEGWLLLEPADLSQFVD